jgi:hypothetical protein
MTQPSLLEVQFPIGPLSLESYKERKANHAQILKTLGKWWGEKPMVLTRAHDHREPVSGLGLTPSGGPTTWRSS